MMYFCSELISLFYRIELYFTGPERSNEVTGSGLKAKCCISVLTCILDAAGSLAAKNEIILGL